ncbi:hypothetical protein ACRJ4W_20710 [Streptomyces sp. GLT-R25]
MADSSWQNALAHYEQLLDRYPGDDLADKARKGARKATQSIELANVRSLLTPGGTGSQPEYCSRPAKYSGAKPMGKGTNRALFYTGNTYGQDYSDKLPGSWKAADAADAVLVVCMGEDTFGSSVRTCPYQGKSSGSTTVRDLPQDRGPGEGLRGAHRQTRRQAQDPDQRVELPLAHHVLHLQRLRLGPADDQVRQRVQVRRTLRVPATGRPLSDGAAG